MYVICGMIYADVGAPSPNVGLQDMLESLVFCRKSFLQLRLVRQKKKINLVLFFKWPELTQVHNSLLFNLSDFLRCFALRIPVLDLGSPSKVGSS